MCNPCARMMIYPICSSEAVGLHPYTAGGPEIVTPLMNATRHQGDSNKFVCAAAAYPHPLFVFSLNGASIVSNSSKHTLVINSTHGTLIVHNLQTSDEGTYTCFASNRYGNVSTAAVLSLQGMFGAVQCSS